MRGVRLAILALLAVIWAAPSHAATKTWSGNYPLTGAVTIPAGDVVTLDANVNLTSLAINGDLKCANKNLALRSGWIMVHGKLQCGTRAVPFTKSFVVTLTGNNPDLDVMGMGNKFLGAMGGGEIMLAGEYRLGWTRLAATARKGASKITLKSAATWRKGDWIVVASTDYNAGHAEERKITAISGKTVTLDKPLAYEHWCATETFNAISLEECAEVGLLTRNIRIEGDQSSVTEGFGGHMMIMSGGKAKLSGVELLRMGQKGILARYPMHWHLVGDATGQYVENSSIVHSYNRFITIHGTHNVSLSGNAGFDTIGHGFYLEDAIEHGNVIERNLGLMVRNSRNGLPTPSDKQASVFWISNPDNTVIRNVAAGSEHTGFWLGFPEHPIGLSATTTVWPRRTPLRNFDSNTSHSNFLRGLMVDNAENPDRNTSKTWYEPRQDPADPDSPIVPPHFTRFTSYKNRYEAIWIRSPARPVISGARLAGSWQGIHFATSSGTYAAIRDSLFVGETANKGNPESWETKGLDGRELPHYWSPHDSLSGLPFYDGPMIAERNLFANFKSNSQRKAGAITNYSPSPFWNSSINASSQIAFLNANRVWLDPLTKGNDGDAFSVIKDIDGSITGIKGRRIVPANPVLLTPHCTRKEEWNAYVCPHNYVGAQVAASAGIDLTGTVLTRDDGANRTLDSDDGSPSSLHFNLIENRPHELKLPLAVPSRLTFIRYEQAGNAARLSLSYPAVPSSVTLWGAKIFASASLAELSAGSTKYYYETSTRKLHLRLVSDDGGWKEFVINR